MFKSPFFRFSPILLLAAILPFFEGCETPLGLVLSHSITLAALILIIFSGQIHIASFLRYFVPFLIFLPLSVYIAPYKFSALLELWDYWVAALFLIVIFDLFKRNADHLEDLSFLVFVVATASTLLTVLLFDNLTLLRWRGSFVNPNDFATFCLLLMIFGFFQYERFNSNTKKVVAVISIVSLMTFITMASSRSVFVASAVVFTYYLWKKRTTRFMKAFIALVLVSSTVALWARFFFFTDPFQFYRFKIWKYSLRGILQDPYLGIGLNMLPYRASQFNFPADAEVGRYARVATTADNQYLQLLIETGFLGFFLFLIGWIALFFVLRRLENRFLAFRAIYLAVSIICLFMLPFDNTAILFLFVFLIAFPFTFDPLAETRNVAIRLPVRVAIIFLSIGLWVFAVLFPYQADREFRMSLHASDAKQSELHLRKAMKLNPFQPYYPFSRIKRIVDARPTLQPQQWTAMVSYLNSLSVLNPLEPDFQIYKAKIFRTLLEQQNNPVFYAGAVSAYASAIQLSPHNVFLRAEYAFFESRRGNLERASAELNSILKLEPAYLNARLLLAQIKWTQGNIKEARSHFQEFERLYGKYKSPRPSVNEPYVRRLLQVDPRYREEVRRLIL